MYNDAKNALFLELASDLRELADKIEFAIEHKKAVEDGIQLLREFEEARKLFK